MEKDATIYEIGLLLKTGLKEEEILSFYENLRNFITEKRGLIISEGDAKKQIELAYPIKKESFAFFNWIKFTIETAEIKNVKIYLDKQPFAIRHIIMKTAKDEPAKTISFKSKKIASDVNNDVKKTEDAKSEQAEIETTDKRSDEDIEIKEQEIDKKIEELLGE